MVEKKFCKLEEGGEIVNKKGAHLGYLMGNDKWKKLCFHPETDSYFTSSCLREIADMMDKVDSEKPSIDDKCSSNSSSRLNVSRNTKYEKEAKKK